MNIALTARADYRNWPLPFLAAFALCLAMLPTARGAIIAESSFDTDAEGWTIEGDAPTPSWLSMGGNPGGHIRGQDFVGGITWFFSAPSKFLGNVSAAYGQDLTFDLRQGDTSAQYDDRDIVLNGGGMSLFFFTSPNPATTFTSYSVPLKASAGWKFGAIATPSDATEAQMQLVLSSLTSLLIRGEFRSGADTGFLDNVVLNGAEPAAAVPEPASLAIWGLGALGCAIAGYRRRKPAT